MLENQINKIFELGLFEAAKAEGGRLVKEADFEAEKKFQQNKFSIPTLLLCTYVLCHFYR